MRDLYGRAALALLLALLLAAGAAAFAGCGNKSGTAAATGDEEEEAAGPEDTVADFFKAWEKQDARALTSLFDPDSIDQLKESLGSDYQDQVGEYFFTAFPDVRFKGLKYKSDIDRKKATVEVVKGTATYTDEFGDQVSEDVADSDEPITFYLVKVKDKWYVSIETFPELLSGYDGSQTSSGDYAACPDCGGEGGWYAGSDSACWYCDGSGVQDAQDYCYNCGGIGTSGGSSCDVCGGTGITWDWVPCEYCGGTGLEGGDEWVYCETCGGTGWVAR